MGRPKTDNPRQGVSVRLSPEALIALARLEDGRGTRTQVIEAAIIAADTNPELLEIILAHGAPVQPKARITETSSRKTETPSRTTKTVQTELAASLTAERTQCQHDWAHNQYLGTRCKHCGINKSSLR